MDRRFQSTKTHNNKHGFRGVEWRNCKNMFAAVIVPFGGRGFFIGYAHSAIDAAHLYDNAARKYYGLDAYLNFPKEGEKKSEPSQLQDGICPQGHSHNDHGKINSRGHIICKRCNADSAKRRYKKKKETP